MFILLLVQFYVVDGVAIDTPKVKIEEYTTLQTCELERIRITEELRKVYTKPEDGYFYMECKEVRVLHRKGVTS